MRGLPQSSSKRTFVSIQATNTNGKLRTVISPSLRQMIEGEMRGLIRESQETGCRDWAPRRGAEPDFKQVSN